MGSTPEIFADMSSLFLHEVELEHVADLRGAFCSHSLCSNLSLHLSMSPQTLLVSWQGCDGTSGHSYHVCIYVCPPQNEAHVAGLTPWSRLEKRTTLATKSGGEILCVNSVSLRISGDRRQVHQKKRRFVPSLIGMCDSADAGQKYRCAHECNTITRFLLYRGSL